VLRPSTIHFQTARRSPVTEGRSPAIFNDTPRESNPDELDMHARGGGEIAEIVDVGREDVISVAGDGDERRVDGIDGVRRFQQHARAASQLRVERNDIDTRQEPRELRLAPCASAPHLRDDSAVRLWRPIRNELGLDERDDLPIVALDRKESPGIE
jgi:hypothetical protein